MRRARMRSDDDLADRTDPTDRSRIRANGWPVLPLRLFLAALFCFAGYAKFSYPRFFDPASRNGFKSAVDAAKNGHTPLSGVMGPLSDNASLFGHVTACAEIAIGLGLLVGLLTRLAALGGMILTALIVLSINWNGVKEYTGSSGWFTSVELALAAALSVFLLGGAGPLALDNLFIRARERQRARDDAEPSFRDSDLDDSRRRLQGEPASYEPASHEPASHEPASREPASHEAASRAPMAGAGAGAGTATAQLPTAHQPVDERTAHQPVDERTAHQPVDERTVHQPSEQATVHQPSGYRTHQQQDDEYRDDPEPEPNSLWTQGRRQPEQPPAEPRPPERTDPADR